MATMEAALTPEMLGKLRQIASFRDYEAKFQAEATARAEAEVEAQVKAQAELAKAQAEAEAEARVEAKAAEVIADNLKDFLITRGDKPTRHAFKAIKASRDADELHAWLMRAYQGETLAQLFPEPNAPAKNR